MTDSGQSVGNAKVVEPVNGSDKPGQSDFQVGDRVQVFNPGPRVKGVVNGPPNIAGNIRVRWDDGEVGWPQARLLRKIEDER